SVRKSVWDEWAAKHPEEAEALKDQVREGTKGVTAREMLERKAESVRVKAGEDPMFHSAEADEVRDTLTRQFADAGHSGELAKAEADVALRFAVVMKRTNPGVNKSLSEFTNIVVKSVTESMRETGAESYEQSIGTQGAARLDAADAGNRIDNLGIARQMEEAGKDAKAIWLATGWQRGKEGKWNYDLMDGKINTDLKLSERLVVIYGTALD
ncbi:MAG: hypothetical protein IJR68_07890, partial [Fretibacterium sp.]|nr:hypothetical protein [Fretibacterium sp.]